MPEEKLTTSDCPVCGSGDFTVLFKDRNRRDRIDCRGTYVRCRYCTVVYLRERPVWEDIVRYYSLTAPGLTANAGTSDIGRLRQALNTAPPGWKTLLRRLRFRPHSWPSARVPPASQRLLDLGCGDGAKLGEFEDRGYEIWGVDVSADAVRLCRQLYPEGHFIASKLEDIDLPDNYFDYIRLDNVLEHVPDPGKIVRECYRLLRAPGQLMVYVPNGRSFSLRFLRGDSISAWIPFHLQLFTRESLRRVFLGAGFKDVRLYGYYPESWLPLSVMQKMQKRRGDKSEDADARPPFWLKLLCYPPGWILSKSDMAEELIGVGTK